MSAELAGVSSPSYGYGWFLGEVLGHQLRFHPGDNSGYNAINALLLEDDALIILLSNDERTEVDEIALRLVSAAVGAATRAHPPEA